MLPNDLPAAYSLLAAKHITSFFMQHQASEANLTQRTMLLVKIAALVSLITAADDMITRKVQLYSISNMPATSHY